MKALLFLLAIVSNSFTFAATERVTFSGSRSSQEVMLEEDYYKTFTYTDRVPVTRNVCQDVPVTQNYCEWIPGQRICQTRPICHQTPYGPRCIPTYGCYDTPARQYCRPVTTVQRQCGQTTTYDYVTRTEQRYMYRSQADIEFTFSELPTGSDEIEFDVKLENDQIDLESRDWRGPVVVANLMENENDQRGRHFRSYRISFLSRDEYLQPVSQIPVVDYFNGSVLRIQSGRIDNEADVKVELTLINRLNGETFSFTANAIGLETFETNSTIEINLLREIGRRLYYWQNKIGAIKVKLTRLVNGQVINSDLRLSSSVENIFYF